MKEGRLEISQPFVNQLNNCHVCHVSNIKISGASLMWSWYREISSKNKMNMQLSYSNREYSGSTQLTWRVNTYNLEYQQEYNLNSRHHLIWGGGVLYNRINTRGTYTYSFSPEDFNWAIVNSFIQDEITLLPDKLFLTLGSKFEYHEDLDDIYIQPTVRILGKINKSNVIWGAISRAIRTPSWAEKYPDMRYVRVTSLGNVLYTVTRNYNLEPEQLTSYEIGFRTYFEDKASFSTALFFNKYKKLITLPIPTTYEYELIPIPHVVAHSTPVNGMDGESYGVEVEANFKVTNWWKIFCSYAYSELFLHNELEVPTVVWGEEIEGKSPKNTASVRLLFDLPKNFELNIWLRYSDSIPTLKIPSYFTADVSVSWKPTPNLELSISGTNLFDPTHPEYKTFFFVPSGQSEVERSFTATVKYYF